MPYTYNPNKSDFLLSPLCIHMLKTERLLFSNFFHCHGKNPTLILTWGLNILYWTKFVIIVNCPFLSEEWSISYFQKVNILC